MTNRAVRVWLDRALCAQVDVGDVFYPEGQGASLADAKAICRRCPVITECRQWAMDTFEAYGVWGGLSERERRQLRRAS